MSKLVELPGGSVEVGDDGAESYAVNAQFYEVIFPQQHRAAVTADLLAALARDAPVIEIGAGTGLFTAAIAEHLTPGTELIAVEPSAVMRAAFTTRMVDHPRAADVTLVAGSALTAAVPDDLPPLGALVLLHVLTHLSAAERAAVWDRFVPALRDGGVVVVDPQWPEAPQDVPASVSPGRTLGRYRYDTVVSAVARQDAPGTMEWQMTYRTILGQRVIDEQTVRFPSQVVSRETLDRELADRGLKAVEELTGAWAWRRPTQG